MASWFARKLFNLRRKRTRKADRAAALAAFEARVAMLRPGDIAIDLGANYGAITTILAETGATVHAFEPDPETFRHLSAAVGNRANVTLHNAAVGGEDGTVTLFRAEDRYPDQRLRSEGATIFADARFVDRSDSVEVPMRGIVGLIEELGSVALLKMDIEGAEVPVLEALLDTPHLHRVGAIFVETHERAMPALFDRFMALRARIADLPSPPINLDWK